MKQQRFCGIILRTGALYRTRLKIQEDLFVTCIVTRVQCALKFNPSDMVHKFHSCSCYVNIGVLRGTHENK